MNSIVNSNFQAKLTARSRDIVITDRLSQSCDPIQWRSTAIKTKKKKSRLIYKRQWRIIQTPWPQITQPTSIMLIWLHKTTSSWEMTTLSKGLLRFDWKWYFVSDTDLNTSVETNHKLPEQEIKRIPECLKCHKDKTCVCILQISPVESFEFSNTNCIINWNYNLA